MTYGTAACTENKFKSHNMARSRNNSAMQTEGLAILQMIIQGLKRVYHRFSAAQDRRALLNLSQDQLKDIGISSVEIKQEAAKGFKLPKRFNL